MEKNQLEVLARIVLPSEILDYFEITGVEQSSTEIHIHLDELMNPALSDDVHLCGRMFQAYGRSQGMSPYVSFKKAPNSLE